MERVEEDEHFDIIFVNKKLIFQEKNWINELDFCKFLKQQKLSCYRFLRLVSKSTEVIVTRATQYTLMVFS